MNEDLIDEERLNELIALDDPELLKELVAIYIRESEQGLRNIELAIHSRNGTELRAYAHKLKGGSASLGVKKVHALSLEMEKRGEQSNFENIESLLTAIKNEYEKAKEILTNRFPKG